VTPPATGVFDADQAESLAGSDADHWWFESKAAIVRGLIARFAPDPSCPTVDVGAGSGGVTYRLRAANQRIVAVEGSADLTRTCAARGLCSVRALASALPVADGSVGVVTMLDVIEHLPDPRPTLQEARRVLGLGGVAVITVPAHQWLWSDADTALGHVKRYSRPGLRDELGRSDFETLWCSHVFSWLVPPVYATRRAARRTAEEQLGLAVDGPLLRASARVLTRAELGVVRRVALPIGTTVAAVARPA
jgi:SAM-dependent methyltransferase